MIEKTFALVALLLIASVGLSETTSELITGPPIPGMAKVPKSLTPVLSEVPLSEKTVENKKVYSISSDRLRKINETAILDIAVSSRAVVISPTKAEIFIESETDEQTELVVEQTEITEEQVAVAIGIEVNKKLRRNLTVKRLPEIESIEIDDSGVKATVKSEVKIENGKIYIGKTIKAVEIMPLSIESAVKEINAEIKSMELKAVENKPVYDLTVAQPANLFWFIPITIETEAEVNAETGEIESVKEPWWCFLTSYKKMEWDYTPEQYEEIVAIYAKQL